MSKGTQHEAGASEGARRATGEASASSALQSLAIERWPTLGSALQRESPQATQVRSLGVTVNSSVPRLRGTLCRNPLDAPQMRRDRPIQLHSVEGLFRPDPDC